MNTIDSPTVDEYLNEVDPETERKYYGGVHVQCFRCNIALHANLYNYGKFMEKTYGQEVIDELFLNGATLNYTPGMFGKTPLIKLKDKTMEIVKFAKNLTLSKNEKLLRKHGLKDECGVWLDEAIQIEAQLACDDKTDKFVEIAEAKEADEK